MNSKTYSCVRLILNVAFKILICKCLKLAEYLYLSWYLNDLLFNIAIQITNNVGISGLLGFWVAKQTGCIIIIVNYVIKEQWVQLSFECLKQDTFEYPTYRLFEWGVLFYLQVLLIKSLWQLNILNDAKLLVAVKCEYYLKHL